MPHADPNGEPVAAMLPPHPKKSSIAQRRLPQLLHLDHLIPPSTEIVRGEPSRCVTASAPVVSPSASPEKLVRNSNSTNAINDPFSPPLEFPTSPELCVGEEVHERQETSDGSNGISDGTPEDPDEPLATEQAINAILAKLPPSDRKTIEKLIVERRRFKAMYTHQREHAEEVESRTMSLQAANSQFTSRITSLCSRVSELQTTIRRQKSEHDAVKLSTLPLHNAMLKHKQTIRELSSETSTQQEELVRLRDDLARVQEQMAAKTRHMAALEKLREITVEPTKSESLAASQNENAVLRRQLADARELQRHAESVASALFKERQELEERWDAERQQWLSKEEKYIAQVSESMMQGFTAGAAHASASGEFSV